MCHCTYMYMDIHVHVCSHTWTWLCTFPLMLAQGPDGRGGHPVEGRGESLGLLGSDCRWGETQCRGLCIGSGPGLQSSREATQWVLRCWLPPSRGRECCLPEAPRGEVRSPAGAESKDASLMPQEISPFPHLVPGTSESLQEAPVPCPGFPQSSPLCLSFQL